MYTGGSSPYKIMVQSTVSGKPKEVLDGDNSCYLSSGHIVYAENNNLYAVPFDHKKLKRTGISFRIAKGILRSPNVPQYAISDSGILIFISGQSNQAHLEWYNRQGDTIGSVGIPGSYRQLALSPNEDKIIVSETSLDGRGLSIFDLNRDGFKSPIVSTLLNRGDPIWSPDEKYIAFSEVYENRNAIYRKLFSEEGEGELLLKPDEGSVYAEDWSPDGEYIVYLNVSDTMKIYKLFLSGDKNSELIHEGQDVYDEPNVSPNGKWIAYDSTESGMFTKSG